MSKKSISCFLFGIFMLFLVQMGLWGVRPAMAGENVNLPLKSAIYFSLDKLGPPLYTPLPEKVSSTDVVKVSLNLGITVADSIVCAKNHNKALFQQNLTLMYGYARILNVSKNILAYYSQIQTALNQNNFAAIDQLLEKVRTQVNLEMNQTYRQEHAKMAYVSGWLEGLLIAARTLEKNYNLEKTVVLRHPALLDTLSSYLNALSPGFRQKPEIQMIVSTLPKIRLIMMHETYSRQDVTALGNLAGALRYRMVH